VKVFIADDSEMMREILIAELACVAGIEIIGTAQDGLEAIESIDRLKPDVVIVDMRMPGASGLVVLRHVKQSLPATRVIIWTNYPSEPYRQESLMARADCFLDKLSGPRSVSELLRRWMQE